MILYEYETFFRTSGVSQTYNRYEMDTAFRNLLSIGVFVCYDKQFAKSISENQSANDPAYLSSIETLDHIRLNPLLSLVEIEQELSLKQSSIKIDLKYASDELRRWALYTVESA
jgi:hypothetical protein